MTQISCASCGLPIDERPDTGAKDRRACPRCGSTARVFEAEVTLSAAASVTPQLVGLRLVGHAPTVTVTAPPAELKVTAVDRMVAAGDALAVGIGEAVGVSEAAVPSPIELPDVLLQAAVLRFGDKAADGQLVAGVAVPWFEIIRQLKREPAFLYTIDWRKLEELIAGAYERDGWPEVVLTPRSGDLGRDIIATKPGIGCIKILDQVKAYNPGHLVTAEEVRAMAGVLSCEQNVSKAFVTTTSRFAPGIETDPLLQRVMPYRLELKDGAVLLDWLSGLLPTQ